MFEPGFDQAAGLRGELPSPRSGTRFLALASPTQPSHAFEWLCQLALDLCANGQNVVVLDANASERSDTAAGLIAALDDPAMAYLSAGADTDWLVLPARHGLQAVLATARTAGTEAAMARLLAPFSADALVMLFAPAPDVCELLDGRSCAVLVPLTDRPQASIDAYASVKLLHAVEQQPVLAPLDVAAQSIANVVDCAARHLGLALPVWPRTEWAYRLCDEALLPATTPTHDAQLAMAGREPMVRRVPATPSVWS